jgi:hypothetical protein
MQDGSLTQYDKVLICARCELNGRGPAYRAPTQRDAQSWARLCDRGLNARACLRAPTLSRADAYEPRASASGVRLSRPTAPSRSRLVAHGQSPQCVSRTSAPCARSFGRPLYREQVLTSRARQQAKMSLRARPFGDIGPDENSRGFTRIFDGADVRLSRPSAPLWSRLVKTRAARVRDLKEPGDTAAAR